MEDTIETLTNKYTQKCAQIADAQFKIKAMQNFIEAGFKDLQDLDKAAFELKQKQEASKPVVVPNA